jgi:hypothetical protein
MVPIKELNTYHQFTEELQKFITKHELDSGMNDDSVKPYVEELKQLVLSFLLIK